MRGSRRRLWVIPMAMIGALLALVAVQFIGASSAVAARVDITGPVSCANQGSDPVSSSGAPASGATGTASPDGTCSPPTHVAAAPTGADGDCDSHSQPTITAPDDSGVAYALDGTPMSPGSHSVTTGTHTVAATSSTLTLTAPTSFEFDLHAASGCTAKITPGAPTFTDDHCADFHPVGSSFTIPSSVGIDYLVRGVVTPAGTYAAFDGSSLTVRVRAQPGYVLSQTITFTHRFTATPICATSVVSTAPSFTPTSCQSSGSPAAPTYTIPTTVGVVYSVNGAMTGAGTYLVSGSSTLTVVAQPDPGYVLVGTTTWFHDFSSTATCPVAVVPVRVHFAAATCASGRFIAGSYRVPHSSEVVYLVHSVTVSPGRHTVRHAETVTVIARARPGYILSGRTSFAHTFGKTPATCRGTGGRDRHRATTDGHHVAPVVAPAKPVGAPVGLATTGLPVTELLLGGAVLLLMGVLSMGVAAKPSVPRRAAA